MLWDVDDLYSRDVFGVFQLAMFFSALWCLSLLVYLLSGVLQIAVFASPLALVVFCLLYLLNPFRVLHHKARRWLLKVLVSFRSFSLMIVLFILNTYKIALCILHVEPIRLCRLDTESGYAV